MKFEHKDEGLQIQYSWKERFKILFLGKLDFDFKSSYNYYSHWMNFICAALSKYGDGHKHGLTQPEDPVETK